MKSASFWYPAANESRQSETADSGASRQEIAGVISNVKNAYALERAEEHGIRIHGSPKDYDCEIFPDYNL